jgi:DNA mismatch repair protein MutS2
MILNLLNSDNPILEQLEWNIIIKEVTKYAHFPEYSEKSIFQQPLLASEIEDTYSKTELMEKIYFSDHFPATQASLTSLKNEKTINESIFRLQKSASLDVTELNSLALLLEFNYEFRDVLNTIEPITDEAQTFLGKLNKIFLKEFRQLVNKDGSINYEGHPLLKSLHEKKTKLEVSIRNFLGSLQSSNLHEKLQYTGHDIINDHYVIPIRSDSYSSSIGEIISRSESGNTLFVEPFEIRDLSFKRLNTIVEIQNIIYKITKRFSDVLAEFIDNILELSSQVFIYDTYCARIQYAINYKLSRPAISNKPEIHLKSFFHPLIEKPVKNSLEIENDSNGLVISGPNTGGKTVTLKSILISLLSLRHGLFVPAQDATLFPYDGLYYFGNDQQNLTEGLSSFAAEVQNYNRLLNNLESTNAIFIDEVFNSTSSEEASALALSYFDSIHKSTQAHIFVSTHHQMLKSYIHQNESYVSCHVGFDSDNHRPTYKLIFGVPGSSMALEIFQLLSNNDQVHRDIYDNSLSLLDGKVVNYNELLEKLSKKQGELDKLILENKTLNNELKNQKKAMDGVYKLKAKDKIDKLEEELKSIKQEAEKILEETKSGAIKSEKNLYKSYKDLQKKSTGLNPLQSETEEAKPLPSHYKEADKLIEGNKYYCTKINSDVILKSYNEQKDEAVVSKGAFNLKCKREDLRHSNQLDDIKRKFVFKLDKTSDAQIEYDCRGMRLEEFQEIVNRSISDILCGDVPFVSFIHGHGDGILKSWIRKYITRHKDLKWDQGENGNDGETKITLK